MFPAMAEEITVTVPMDTPAEAPAEAAETHEVEYAEPAAPASVAEDTSGASAAPDVEEAPAAAPAAEAEAPAPVVEAPAPAAEPQHAVEEAPAPAEKSVAPKAAIAPAKPKKTAKSCKDLDADACGKNKLCIWVVDATAVKTTGTTAANDDTKASCRSLALMKKEAKKHAKAAKDEVLPWAAAPAAPSGSGNKAAAVHGTTGASEAAPAAAQ